MWILICCTVQSNILQYTSHLSESNAVNREKIGWKTAELQSRKDIYVYVFNGLLCYLKEASRFTPKRIGVEILTIYTTHLSESNAVDRKKIGQKMTELWSLKHIYVYIYNGLLYKIEKNTSFF